MEIIKFFFTNFWHWLGGLIYLMVIFSGGIIRIIKAVENNYNEKDKDG